MNTFSRYVLRSFLWQFALLIGFTALLQLFDLLNNSADILQDHLGDMSAVAEYAALRLPEIASFLIPFAVLMGALITLGRMERNNEIMAFKAAGAPYFTVLWAFLPAVGIVAFLHFFLADQLVPISIQTLVSRDLIAERSKSKNETKNDPLFVQEGNSVIEAGAVGLDGVISVMIPARWLNRFSRMTLTSTALPRNGSSPMSGRRWFRLAVLRRQNM